MKHKKIVGILATSALLLGSVATLAACGGGKHTIERVDETQATCTEGGHAAYYKCTDDGCGKLFSDIEGKHEIKWEEVEKTDPLGHDMTHVTAKDADCTQDGAKDHYHCERCENDFKDEAGATAEPDAVIPALGHDMKVVEKVIPVTGAPGIKAHYRCERENNQEYFDSFGDKKVTDENRHELEYDMLTTAPNGWYATEHDFSHSNDADPYMLITGEYTGKNGLNVATSEFYTDLAFTARVQKSKGTREYIELFFENKTIYSVYVEGGKIYHNGSAPEWDYDKNGYTNLTDDWADGYTLSKGELDCYEGNGLEVTLARTGKTVKVLVNGREVHSATLSDGYVNEPVQGVMRVWSAHPGEKYYFRAEPQAAKPAAPKVEITPVDEAQGEVTLNKETFAYGDELIITVAPTDDYVLDTLVVNGRDVTALVKDGAYATTATGSVQITATFVTKEFGSVNAAVTGAKHGLTGSSVAGDAAYELVGKNKTYTGTLTGGKLAIDKVIVGEYTLNIEGHIGYTVTVEKDKAYDAAIALEYNLFTVNKTNNVGAESVDLTHQNGAESYIEVVGNPDGHLNVTANERYGDVMVTATFKRENVWNQRMGFLLAFSDKEGVQLGFDTFDDPENVTLHFWYDGKVGDYQVVRDYYNFKQDSFARLNGKFDLMGCAPLTAEWLEKFDGDGLEVSLVRKGNRILALVEGVTVGMVEVDSKYADDTVQLGFFAEWVKPMRIPFGITTALPAFEAPTLTLTQGEHGTVTAGDAASVWEKITLEIAPDSNYRLKQLTVNGIVITGNRTEYSFYPVAGSNTVVAVFEQIPYGSVNAEIVGVKHGETASSIADGTKVTLLGEDGVKYEVTVASGKIAVDEAVAGTYTVKIDGYLDGTITVAEGAAYATKIELEYSYLLSENMHGVKTDVSHQNEADSYIEVVGAPDGHVNVFTRDRFEDIVFSATFKAGNSWRERKGVMLAFSDKKGVQIGFDSFSDNNTENVTLYFWGAMQNGDNAQVGANEKYIFESTDRLLANEQILGCNPVTGELYEKYKTTGLTLTVARSGNMIYVLLDGEMVSALSVDESYAEDTVVAGVFTEWAKPQQIPFSVSKTLPAFTAPTFTLTQGEHGTVTKTSGDSYAFGEEITLSIAPASNYRLKQLTVNGVAVTGNKTEYSFYPVAGENTVVAEFEQIPYGSVNASVTGKKHGAAGNAIADGTKVTLIGADNVKYENVTVTGGKISIDDVVAGTYAVKVNGYFDGSITVAEGTAYTTEIALVYNAITVLPDMWYNNVNDCLKLEHMNDEDPYFVSVQNGVQVITSNSYSDLLFSIKVKQGEGNKYWTYFLFDDNKYVMTTLDQRNGTSHFALCSSVDAWDFQKGRENLLNNIWTGYDFNDDEQTAYSEDGITISLYRTGANVYAYVGEKLVFTQSLDSAYATKQVRAGVFIFGSIPNGSYYFGIDEHKDVDLSATVTVTTPQNGTVTPSKTTGAFYDEITLDITPDEGYRIKSVSVNGKALQATEGVYKFNALTENTVVAEFEKILYGSVNAEIVGNKHGATGSSIQDGTKIKLVGPKEYTVAVTDGKLACEQVEVGTYAVKLDGYLDGSITVAEDTPYVTKIALEYSLFKVNNTNGIGADKVDLSHQNEENGYINVTGDGGHLNVTAGDRYGDIMLTATFKRANVWNQRMGFLLAFSDKEGVQLGFDTLNTDNVTLHFWYDGNVNGYGVVRDKYNFNGNARLNGAFNLDGCAPLKAEWLEKFDGEGLQVSLARKGNVILAFVEGVVVGAVEVDQKYAADTVQLGFFAEWVNPMQIPFEITETLSTPATTFTLTQGENGTVTKTTGDTYSVWEKITLEITPDSDYRLKQLTVNGVVITGNKTEYSFYPVAGENTVVPVFEQIPNGNITFSADEKWNADGLVVTFQRNGETKQVTLGDNAVIENMTMDSWTATTVVGNMTVSLGEVFIDKQDFTLDLAKIFNNADLANRRIESANLATGEFVYNTEPDGATLWLNTVNVAQGSTYVSTKLSLSDESKEFLKNSGDKHETFTIFLKVGDVEKNVTLWWKLDEGNFKFYSMDNWQGVDVPADLKNAFIEGDGFYTVWTYNAESGKYEIYAGLTPQTVTKIGEWDTGLPQNGTLTAIGFGDGFKWGGDSYRLNVQMNCGATLNEALGITD